MVYTAIEPFFAGGPVRNRTGIAGLGNRCSILLSYGAAFEFYRGTVRLPSAKKYADGHSVTFRRLR